MTLRNAPFHLDGAADHAVLLVHGLGGGPYEVQRLAERLTSSLGVTTHGLHLPGHNVPSTRMPDSAWPDWYAAVLRAHAELRSTHARVDVVGFSTGCPLLLHLAAQVGIQGRMVLLAPFVRVFQPPLLSVPTGDLVRKLDFLPWVPRRRPPLRDAALRDEISKLAWFKTFNLRATRSALELIDLVLAEAKEISTPTLIIQGRRDTVVAPPGAEILRSRLGGPCELVWMDQSDHLLTLDADAASVLETATRFLRD